MGQKGFTLVELSIVLIIIGLIIGGIIKGQELVTNARVASGIGTLKTIDAAVTTFKQAYGNMPGDINNSSTRVPNCTGNCATNGNENGYLDQTPDVVQSMGNEASAFWAQLSAANILGGIDSVPTGVIEGESHPKFDVNGALRIGYHQGGAPINGSTTLQPSAAGHYIAVTRDLNANADNVAANALTPSEAYRLDVKIDDDVPNTGILLASGTTAGGVNDCTQGTTIDSPYNTDDTGLNCSFFFRIQISRD